MKNLLQKIWSHRYLILLVVLILVLIPDISFAAAAKKTAYEEFTEKLGAVLQWLLSWLYPVIWTIVGFTGSLMDNTFILSPEIEDVIKKAWQEIRNYVNLFFTLALVIIAIYNILGKTDGNAVLKTALPKFVIALIAVNFSFYIGKAILDFNNLATTAVLAIPAKIDNRDILCYEQKADKSGWEPKTCVLPKYIYISLNKIVTEDKNGEVVINDQLVRFSEGDGFETKLNPTMFNQNTFGLILAYNIFNVKYLIEVAQDAKDLSALTINAFFSIIFLIIYGAIFVAIALVLLGRAAVVWVTLALSPAVALFYAMEGILPNIEKFDIKGKFLANAFAPFILSVPIAVSFILINAATQSKLIDFEGTSPGHNALVNVSGISTLTLDAEGGVKGFADSRAILWYIAVVVLLFSGVKAAASGSVVGFLVDSILDNVKRAGQTVAKLPGLIPIVPVGPTKQRSSLAAIWGGPKMLMDKIESMGREQADDLWRGKGAAKRIGKISNATNESDYRKSIGESIGSGDHNTDPKSVAQAIVQKINLDDKMQKALNSEFGDKKIMVGKQEIEIKLLDLKTLTSEESAALATFLTDQTKLSQLVEKAEINPTKTSSAEKESAPPQPPKTAPEVLKMSNTADQAKEALKKLPTIAQVISPQNIEEIFKLDPAARGKLAELEPDKLKELFGGTAPSNAFMKALGVLLKGTGNEAEIKNALNAVTTPSEYPRFAPIKEKLPDNSKNALGNIKGGTPTDPATIIATNLTP